MLHCAVLSDNAVQCVDERLAEPRLHEHVDERLDVRLELLTQSFGQLAHARHGCICEATVAPIALGVRVRRFLCVLRGFVAVVAAAESEREGKSEE